MQLACLSSGRANRLLSRLKEFLVVLTPVKILSRKGFFNCETGAQDFSLAVQALHIRNHIVAEFGAFNLRSAFHEASEIIGHAFRRDRPVKSFDD